MSTPTLTNADGQSTQSPSGRHQRHDARDAHRALWAMTRDEWAEITNEAGVDPEEVDP